MFGPIVGQTMVVEQTLIVIPAGCLTNETGPDINMCTSQVLPAGATVAAAGGVAGLFGPTVMFVWRRNILPAHVVWCLCQLLRRLCSIGSYDPCHLLRHGHSMRQLLRRYDG
jgi:hypothetical protein